MGLFGLRRRRTDPAPPVPAGLLVLGSGRRLHTALERSRCIELLHSLADEVRPGIPRVLPAACSWAGEGPGPGDAFSLQHEGTVLVGGLWTVPDGTDAGLFPLDDGPERLIVPVIGHWKQSDPSLRSTGLVAGGQLGLFPPQPVPDLVSGALAEAGFPATPENTQAIVLAIRNLVLTRSLQFIGSTEPAVAKQFEQAHRDASSEEILHHLAEWDARVVPYVQDLYFRARAILLERGPGGEPAAVVWREISG